MKKILLLVVLASTVLFGQEVRHIERMKNMQAMETAMATIQKGFLYNNLSVVKNGVRDLKKTASFTESFIKEGAVSKSGVNTHLYAKNQTERITIMADEILDSFAKGDRYAAANGYLMVLSKCLSCHQTVRSW
jgi:cytochrome c556